MKILIVAATAEETSGIDFVEIERSIPHDIEVHITGIGMVATSYSLTKKLIEGRYDMAMNIGLAGTFNNEIEIGNVVEVSSDCFAELGAEDDEKFLRLDELGLIDKNASPFKDGKLTPKSLLHTDEIVDLKKVSGITVNKVHGNEKSINKVKTLFNPEVESMEGAAFFYVCMMENVPCIQIRAISNKVEKRNREEWNIPLALKNLSNKAANFISEIGR